MATILDKITIQTAEDLAKRRRNVSLKELESFESYEKGRLDFVKALSKENEVSIIAEVKKASPSKGIIRNDFNAVEIAMRYQEGGAAAISVLTDEPFFKGSLSYLQDVSMRVEIPVLRKDFIIDPYQIKEARAFGADAILLIVRITNGNQLNELLLAASEYGITPLVECYDDSDFDRLDFNLIKVLGVNNRDLNTFDVDVHRGIQLLQKAPKGTLLVSESGLSTSGDLALLQKENIHAALIGEYFMKQEKPGKAVKELILKSRDHFRKTYDHE